MVRTWALRPGRPQTRKVRIFVHPCCPLMPPPYSQPTRVRLGASSPFPSLGPELEVLSPFPSPESGWRCCLPRFPIAHQWSCHQWQCLGDSPLGLGWRSSSPFPPTRIGLEVLPPPSSSTVSLGVGRGFAMRGGRQGVCSRYRASASHFAHTLSVAAVSLEAMLSVLRQHRRATSTSPTCHKLGRPGSALPPCSLWANDSLVCARTCSLWAQ